LLGSPQINDQETIMPEPEFGGIHIEHSLSCLSCIRRGLGVIVQSYACVPDRSNAQSVDSGPKDRPWV
jgi:hypothetical protein